MRKKTSAAQLKHPGSVRRTIHSESLAQTSYGSSIWQYLKGMHS